MMTISFNTREPQKHQAAARTLLIALVLSVAMTAHAQVAQPEPATLPDVPLLMINGTAVSTGKALPSQGRWLLIHVQPGCAPCDALLNRIQTDAPAVVPRLVIIVSRASAADVEKMSGAFAALGGAAWFSDEPAGLGSALRIQEAPLVLAMNDRAIQWTLAGVLSGSQRLRDVLTGWVTAPGE
jgi:hypothetical protein